MYVELTDQFTKVLQIQLIKSTTLFLMISIFNNYLNVYPWLYYWYFSLRWITECQQLVIMYVHLRIKSTLTRRSDGITWKRQSDDLHRQMKTKYDLFRITTLVNRVSIILKTVFFGRVINMTRVQLTEENIRKTSLIFFWIFLKKMNKISGNWLEQMWNINMLF
jgi:hypothetical protein